jgi:hypothetical protein
MFLSVDQRRRGVGRFQDGVSAMKSIVSALIALSVLAGIAAPASALDDNVLGGRTSVEQDRIVY